MVVRKEERGSRGSEMFTSEVPASVFLVLTSVMVAVCFHNATDGTFVFDDSEAVVNNYDIQLSTPVSQIFSNDFWGTPIIHNSSHKSYRPITILSFRLNVWAAGGELVASQFRTVNVLLYGFVCCLAFYVLKSICDEYPHAAVPHMAALLFTVHPVHTEAIAPAVGRADLLCAALFFSAFLVYNCSLNGKHHPVLRLFCILLTINLAAVSMFAKEQGITVLALCSLYDVLNSYKVHPRNLFNYETWISPKTKWFLIRQSLLLFSTMIFLLFRWWIMGGTEPVFQKADNPASFHDNAVIRGINYIYIYTLNVWLLLCPEWLCYDWSMGCVPLIDSLYDIRVLFAVTFVAVFGCLVISLLTQSCTQARVLVLALGFIVIPFLPASNVFLRVGFVIAERTLFVPSLGFCLLVAHGMQKLSTHRSLSNVVILLLGLLIVVLSVRSSVRSREWSSEKELFLSALSICPLNAKVHYNLAKTSSNLTVAVKHYRDALRLNPDYDQAMNNLANILKDRNDLVEAEELLRRALQLRPNFAAAWMNLGIVLSNKKNFKEAEVCYWNAIKYRRKYPDCYYNLGNLYLEQKEHQKAFESWRQATLLNPQHHAAWNNLIIMLDSIGKHEEASTIAQEALSIFPNSSAIHFNLANSLGKISNFTEAEKHFKLAIDIYANNPLYFVNLGVLYHRWKKLDLAKNMYLKALKLNPNLKSAKDNLHLLQN
ncbi:protein O-mannosyl-transferase TMTC4-like isoform X2 [Macrosteles quadrilineatus]|uniref:protein O-mannosyl-transferase TMTC4-like isoform X2 n=1 Tax=Macrosteles quadrilineatus TaxID=74068 RepID=UPI0023E29FE8|nr:protein O-mannosyl-transferase TMTC4-like isoform X2 [Macrosteles quadrilineatus]XP_054281016.1 protein O-mannosyl-transferase TMTC4-like isoform X2 [Macrosteles quadrilineatus]